MPTPKSAFTAVVLEALIVAMAGVALALAANAISPRGLSLTRDYFPTGQSGPKPAPVVSSPTATNEPTEEQDLARRLHDKGLQELKRAEAEGLYRDPRTQTGQIVFVDARDPDHYSAGHIPGAYEFDPYHPEKELATVVPAAQGAQQVVVYCTGGDCEDADTAAIMLRDAGVPDKQIFVYGGGYNEWDSAHLPLETGVRHSGSIK